MANNSNTNNNPEDKSKEAGTRKRTSNGRRKIPIEKITDPTKKHVTFSKRRVGLFKKASELCALCGVEMAIVTFSERGKAFSFGHPDPDVVVQRYLTYGTHCSDPEEDRNNSELALMLEEHNRRQDETKRKIEEEKRFADYQAIEKRRLAQNGEKNGKSDNFWWDEAPVDEMGLDELEQFMACLVELRNNVAKKVDELTGTTLPFLPNPMGNILVHQIDTNHIKSNSLGYSPRGFRTVSNLKCSDSAQSFSSSAGMLNTNNSLMALEDSPVDVVSQSYNFGFMSEAREMNGIILEDGTQFSNLSQGMEFFNVAVTNHKLSMMEDRGNPFTNPDIPHQAFKFGTQF